MSLVHAAAAAAPDEFLPGHPNAAMWIRIMQRAALTIQVCVRAHLARSALQQAAAALRAKQSPRNKLGKRMNALRSTSDSVGVDVQAAGPSAPKMSLRDAALNVMFVNMLLNRTFLRSQQEQKELENAVRSSFPCFEGVKSDFLNELMATAQVKNTSHLTPHTSHLTPHTSHLTPHTSHLTPHTSPSAAVCHAAR
jgi:hypothetical protein